MSATRRKAEVAVAAGRWAEAGDLYAQLAEAALAHGDRVVAAETAGLAADAFRRDDRPARAARMLRLVPGSRRLMDQIQLAAVLMDAGELRAAADIARDARTLSHEPAEQVLAADTLAGILLAVGEVEAARREVDAITALELPGGEVARRFRQAQLDRLDGAISAATKGWEDLAQMLAPYPQARGPAAACWMELGELHLLLAGLGFKDQLATAVRCIEQSRALWAEVGRRVGLFRAEAWLLRAEAMAGRAVLPTVINRALAYAEERQLPLLLADLRVCRAVVTGEPADALTAVALTPEAPLARGRARVVALELGAAADVVDTDAMFMELVPDALWAARGMCAVPALRTGGLQRVEALRSLVR